MSITPDAWTSLRTDVMEEFVSAPGIEEDRVAFTKQ